MRKTPFIDYLGKDAARTQLTECIRIVVFRALNLGDLLCAIPFFRTLKANLPCSHICLISLAWAQVIQRRFAHYIDEFIPFPGYPGLPEIANPEEKLVSQFLENVQRKKFDLAIQLHGSGKIVNPLVRQFEAKWVAGFYEKGQDEEQFPLFMPYPKNEHEVWRFLKLAEHMGLTLHGHALEFPLIDEDLDELGKIPDYHRLKSRVYVCLHPGAGAQSRQWSIHNFAKLGDFLYERGCNVVLTGVSSEQDLTKELEGRMKYRCFDFAKYGLSLGASARLVADARLVVTNDTGMAHLAAALKIASIVIFMNPTVIPYWHPLNPARIVLVNGRDENCLQVSKNAALEICGS